MATPKKSLGQRTLEKNALRNSLPTRFIDNDDEKRTYSKEYLEELQSSTPSTPQNLRLSKYPTTISRSTLQSSMEP